MGTDQIYIAALVEAASRTEIGQTWLLDKSIVMVDLNTGDRGFDQVQKEVEVRLPGKWDKQPSADGRCHAYKRTG